VSATFRVIIIIIIIIVIIIIIIIIINIIIIYRERLFKFTYTVIYERRILNAAAITTRPRRTRRLNVTEIFAQVYVTCTLYTRPG